MINKAEKESLKKKLAEFLRAAPSEKIIKELIARGNFSEQQAKNFLETYFNEAFVSLDLVIDEISYDMKLLEVGAGICIFSLFLKKIGFDIIALEPSINAICCGRDLA